MRTKVLITLDPDVLALIDERAKRHGMTRSGYVAAACLGLIRVASDDSDSDSDDAIAGERDS